MPARRRPPRERHRRRCGWPRDSSPNPRGGTLAGEILMLAAALELVAPRSSMATAAVPVCAWTSASRLASTSRSASSTTRKSVTPASKRSRASVHSLAPLARSGAARAAEASPLVAQNGSSSKPMRRHQCAAGAAGAADFRLSGGRCCRHHGAGHCGLDVERSRPAGVPSRPAASTARRPARSGWPAAGRCSSRSARRSGCWPR